MSTETATLWFSISMNRYPLVVLTVRVSSMTLAAHPTFPEHFADLERLAGKIRPK